MLTQNIKITNAYKPFHDFFCCSISMNKEKNQRGNPAPDLAVTLREKFVIYH